MAPGDEGFEELLLGLAQANGWMVEDINERRAMFRFDLPSKRTAILYAIDLDGLVELSVPSSLVFDTGDDVPRDLMATCLRRSAKAKVGFWCLEQIETKQVLTYMWNVPRRHLDPTHFGDVVRALVVGCDQLETDVTVDPAALDRELHALLDDPGLPDDPPNG